MKKLLLISFLYLYFPKNTKAQFFGIALKGKSSQLDSISKSTLDSVASILNADTNLYARIQFTTCPNQRKAKLYWKYMSNSLRYLEQKKINGNRLTFGTCNPYLPYIVTFYIENSHQWPLPPHPNLK